MNLRTYQQLSASVLNEILFLEYMDALREGGYATHSEVLDLVSDMFA